MAQHALLLEPAPVNDAGVLGRMVEELKIEQLVPHYRVYASRFSMHHSTVCEGTFMYFEAARDPLKDSHRMYELRENQKDAILDTQCFEETTYLINGQSVPYSITFLKMTVRDITVKNVNLFGDRIVWKESFKGSDPQNVETEQIAMRKLSDALMLADDGIISAPKSLAKEEIQQMGLHVKIRRGKRWTNGIISKVADDKICVRFEWNSDEVDSAEFALDETDSDDSDDDEWFGWLPYDPELDVDNNDLEKEQWIENSEFATKLRPTYHGEDDVGHLAFVLTTEEKADDATLRKLKKYEFSEDERFCISISSLLSDQKLPSKIHIYAKPSYAEEFNFVRFKSFDIPKSFQRFGIEYIHDREDHLFIGDDISILSLDPQYAVGGCLQIRSHSQIVIAENVKVVGTGRGSTALPTQFSRGYLKFGGLLDAKKEMIKTLIVEGAGGGVILLISGNGVINNGVMDCSASNTDFFSGGTVMISTDGRCENNGVIECEQDGVVTIECSEFVNKGNIGSVPNILMLEKSMVLPWIQCMTSNTEERPLQLRVHDWRGNRKDWTDHRSDYDGRGAQHLLEEGTETYYQSDIGKGEDWIIFELDESSNVIPTMLGIRNSSYGSGMKHISICTSCDGEHFEQLMQLKDIQKHSDPQVFPLDISSSYFEWRNQSKFWKLKLLKNHGSRWHALAEFVVFGRSVE